MKCANNSNAMVVSSMVYCGLVSGYQGENNTATPQNAAEAVYAALRGARKVYPAVCVYHTDWGCPKGGEPVGAYIASGSPEEILDEENGEETGADQEDAAENRDETGEDAKEK